MAKPKNTPGDAQIITDVLRVTTGTFECCLLGTSPIILNRMSQKVQQELLCPRGRKTQMERLTTLKHDPMAEYRSSPYTLKDPSAPTLIAARSVSFKKAMMTAALDMPGARKAQIGRLTYLDGEHVGIYGPPRFFMRPVRSADMNRTPDIRTRAILPEWAVRLQVTFVQPLIKPQAVANLLAAAGLTVGVGDWRPEKGSGNYGQFRIVDEDDPTFLRIVKTGGRAVQVAGLANPIAYDDESTELYEWYLNELAERKSKGVDTHVSTSNGRADRGDTGAGEFIGADHAAGRRPRRAREVQPIA